MPYVEVFSGMLDLGVPEEAASEILGPAIVRHEGERFNWSFSGGQWALRACALKG